eukprot:TRINITY_DN109_c0_g1_i5.p1 TRINITY_DN109_c0_g1~~TRINITY_DN109_c0_g1_i5.p1  ORF type:complete len:409 (-),score=121.36 TRINITY_DN109_c0_g1_i5:141-1292(-)
MFAFVFVALFALSSAKIFYEEDFSNDDSLDKWVQSTHRPASERGKVGLSAGKYFTNEEEEKGLQTQQDARFYHLSAEFDEEFSNKDDTLVLQYSLKQDQGIDCGGGYIKLHPAGLNQEDYNGDSEYNIMFGPDICGSTRRTHFIITKNGKNHLITKDIPTESDTHTHIYTAIINPDNTFKILIDGTEKRSGNFEDDFTILEPKLINDPSQSKPSDWVDEKYIDDPEDEKPEGYDDIPTEIDDPEAEKPEDWDSELDGEWEAPRIPNPAYKGPWRPKKIENPAYKGEWVHPTIPNPAYKPDPTLYAFDSFKFIGIEIWQVKSGSIFDNFLVTNSVQEAASARAKISGRATGEKLAEEAATKSKEAAADDEDVAGEEEDDQKAEL